MALARHWFGNLVRVSGLSLLVPFGLLLAVAVAATVGGAGTAGVAQLGQLFAGPGIPPATIGPPMPAEHSTGGLAPFSGLVPAVPVTAGTPVHVPALPTRKSHAVRRHALHRTRPTPPRQVVVPTPSPPQAHPQPAPAPPPAPPAPPTPPPSLIRQVGNQLKQIVEPLPKPVGPVAADAVDTVIDLLDPGGRTRQPQPVTQVVGSLLKR